MFTFIICIAALIAGYFFYDRIIEKRINPAIPSLSVEYLQDGIDYNKLPIGQVFFMQLSNIVGPATIFYALSGAIFGPSVYLWIVLGTIFGGGILDFFTGILSLGYNGGSLQIIVEKYFGKVFKWIFSVILIGIIVVLGSFLIKLPSDMLAKIAPKPFGSTEWILLLIVIYIAGAFIPLNKIAGRVYMFTGIFIVATVLLIAVSMIISSVDHPLLEMTVQNLYPLAKESPWPMMFISAGGTVFSGFHAVQIPITARCIRNTSKDRRIYSGTMVVHGFIALIWATAGISFYYNKAGAGTGMQALLACNGGTMETVEQLCTGMLGSIGGVIAYIGVIVSFIMTGISVFRSGRIIIGECFKFDVKKAWLRLLVALVLVAVSFIIVYFNVNISVQWIALVDFILAGFVLCLAAIYLYILNERKKYYYLALIPACFILLGSFTYLFYATNCFTFFTIINLEKYRTLFSTILGFALMIIVILVFRFRVYQKPEKWIGKLQQV